jgi:FkbM family methyltransferase
MAGASVRLLRTVTRALSRLYPLYSGCGTIANSGLYRFLSSNSELVETRLRDGSAIQVHLNDYVGRSLFFFGDLDPKISWVCKTVLRPGDTMLDIGANYGLVTLQASRRVGGSGQVHAFEPQCDLAVLIRSSCERNGYKQATVHSLGLSDADADVTMTVPLHNRGMASVNVAGLSGRTILIKLKNGGDYLRALNLPKVRLIKVDVEGHEAAVFAGARAWLAEARPEVIVFETAEGTQKFREHPAVKVLAGLDYDFFGIPRVRLRMRLVHIPPDSAMHFHDVVAVQRGSSFEAREAGQ